METNRKRPTRVGSELYYWRKTIAGLMLFGVMVYALIPLAGLVGHRFLPPHEHFLMGSAGHYHSDADYNAPADGVDDLCGAKTPSKSGERLVHTSSEASSLFASAPAFACADLASFVLPRNLVARFRFPVPPTTTVLLEPLDPPPNLTAVS